MSFFNDFFESISFEDNENNIKCNIVFGVGVLVFGVQKLESMQETEIVLRNKKNRLRVYGNNLMISSMSRGEVEISGLVQGVQKLWMEQ